MQWREANIFELYHVTLEGDYESDVEEKIVTVILGEEGRLG